MYFVLWTLRENISVVPFTNGYFSVDSAQLASEFVHKHEGVANGSDGPSLIGLNQLRSMFTEERQSPTTYLDNTIETSKRNKFSLDNRQLSENFTKVLLRMFVFGEFKSGLIYQRINFTTYLSFNKIIEHSTKICNVKLKIKSLKLVLKF